MALAMIIQGRHNPPRVAQVAVGPLPLPASWWYVPLSAQVDTAGWLQRPYSLPEAARVAALIARAAAPLVPLMKEAFDGWWYDPGSSNSSCGSRCLVYSLGAPFGAGPAAAAGTRVGPGSGVEGRRWLWAFFYRNLEGHHLHTVGLELQLDVSGAHPAQWAAGQVWLGGSLWPSPQALAAAWNSSRASTSSSSTSTSSSSSSSSSGAQGVDPAALALLRAFHLPSPSPQDALSSSFGPRKPAASTPAAANEAPSQPGPPLQYEPDGRRFRLSASGLGVEHWMGWSLAMGHSPTAGLSFWDVRFQGQRLLWELSLQEAYAGYGGPSPMQSHVQYLDSHWGMGAAYKELAAGLDCPGNAAFLDLPYSFNSGPLLQRNAVCVFELSLGQPLLRHWADAGGSPAYYGAVQGSALVVRTISTVYNYDYIADLRLHLDGSIEVAVHTTGYVQSSWYDRAQHGSSHGYPFAPHNSGTIHDHLLHWKVDADIAGTPNSIRMDSVVLQERPGDEG
ncbi:copper amine oxidase [Scenedesmus sp. NREL 46B-D3]|nr:copper amine oxidase [Scenedesmus sp. NREL 46B-D3]